MKRIYFVLYNKEIALRLKMKRKLHVKIGGSHCAGKKVSIDKSRKDITAGSRVTKMKVYSERRRQGDEFFGETCEKEKENKREKVRKGKKREGEGATNWLQSCELKTQRRTSRRRRGEVSVGPGKGRFETKGAAGTMACNLEPLE